jgi:hypothetical protein
MHVWAPGIFNVECRAFSSNPPLAGPCHARTSAIAGGIGRASLLAGTLLNACGIDPLHLGVLFCVVYVIGLITPPVGVALYGVAMVSKLPIDKVFWATLPSFSCCWC